MAEVFYDEHADMGFLKRKTIGVIGYGNQGRAQALNLRDSGMRVIIGVRADKTRQQAIDDGFEAFPIKDAAKKAQVVIMLIPDEVMPEVFRRHILRAPAVSGGQRLSQFHRCSPGCYGQCAEDYPGYCQRHRLNEKRCHASHFCSGG